MMTRSRNIFHWIRRMRFVRWLVGLVVFAGLLLLALQNAEPVTLACL